MTEEPDRSFHFIIHDNLSVSDFFILFGVDQNIIALPRFISLPHKLPY
jgi:hypothetical protein